MSTGWKIVAVVYAAMMTYSLTWGEATDALVLLAFITGLILGATPDDHPRRDWIFLGVITLALITALLGRAVEKGWVQ